MANTATELLEIFDTKTNIDGYTVRPSYHVTQLFIGGNKKQMQNPIYQHYEVGKVVKVSVRALLFVPGKILTAVCFPEADVDNKFPHMTLLLGKWPAKNSNMALEYTCTDSKQPFHNLYNYASQEGKGGKDHSGFVPDYTFEKGEKAPAYFTVLANPIVF
jgi:hypothetical protein